MYKRTEIDLLRGGEKIIEVFWQMAKFFMTVPYNQLISFKFQLSKTPSFPPPYINEVYLTLTVFRFNCIKVCCVLNAAAFLQIQNKKILICALNVWV